MYILETPQLRIRKFTLQDAAFLVELLNTPLFLQFIGDRKVRTIADAEAYLKKGALASYEKNGFGMYLVEEKQTQAPVGACGLVDRPGLENIDMGFALLPEYIGLGYGLEVAKAVFDYAFSRLGLNKLVAIVMPENKRSIHILEKLGMHFEKMITLPDDDTQLMLFSS
jgi:RimJ/RimL family protein N-acetyltransferase